VQPPPSETRGVLLGVDGRPLNGSSSDSDLLSGVGGVAGKVKDAGVLLTISGVLLYAILRSVYALFYGKLGVQPEEIGLGYTEVLAQSVVGVMLLAGLVVAFFLIIYGTFRLFLAPSLAVGVIVYEHVSRSLLVRWLLAVALFAAFFAFVWFAGPPSWIYLLIEFVVIAMVFGLVNGQRVASTAAGRDRDRGLWRDAYDRGRRWTTNSFARIGLKPGWTILGCFGLAIFLVFEILFLSTPSDANDVKAGRSVAGMEIGFLDFPVLTNRAERAHVWFQTDVPAWISNDCLMYLGQSATTTVFYAVRSQRIVRLPTATTGVAFGRLSHDCPERRHLGEAILLEGIQDGNHAKAMIQGIERRGRRVDVRVWLRNTGESPIDESLASDLTLIDQRGRLLQPLPAPHAVGYQRIHVQPGAVWEGKVRFRLPAESTPNLVEMTLAGGHAPRGGQWDLTVPFPPAPSA
jgi:hypothetical protein